MNKSRDLVNKFMTKRGWHTQLPDHVAKSISIEAAELLELFQWANPEISEVKSNKKILGDIKGELADVFIYAIQMALILEIDIEEIVKNKIAHASRKYPVHLMKRRSKGESLATKEYLEIKKAYRRMKKSEK